MFLGGMISDFLSDNDFRKKEKGLFPLLPLCLFLFFIVAFRCIYLKNNKKEGDTPYPSVALIA